MGFLFDSLRRKNAQRYQDELGTQDEPAQQAAPEAIPAPVAAPAYMEPIAVPQAPEVAPPLSQLEQDELARQQREREATAHMVRQLWQRYQALMSRKAK